MCQLSETLQTAVAENAVAERERDWLLLGDAKERLINATLKQLEASIKQACGIYDIAAIEWACFRTQEL